MNRKRHRIMPNFQVSKLCKMMNFPAFANFQLTNTNVNGKLNIGSDVIINKQSFEAEGKQ